MSVCELTHARGAGTSAYFVALAQPHTEWLRIAEIARHFCVSCSAPPDNTKPLKLGTPTQPYRKSNFHKLKTPKCTSRTAGQDRIAKEPLAPAGKHRNTPKISHNPMKSGVNGPTNADKQPKIRSNSEVSQSNSLILFDVLVCNDNLLEQKVLFDQAQQSNSYNKLGVNINLGKPCKLYRGIQPPRGNSPPLRVTLGPAKDAEINW
ncbi:unnamed protein product [Trichobilharzia regenti]|nr:unnamed protein product [Trichobilharzia regenti]